MLYNNNNKKKLQCKVKKQIINLVLTDEEMFKMKEEFV